MFQNRVHPRNSPLNLLKDGDPFVVAEDALETLERRWTGFVRSTTDELATKPNYFAKMTFATYIELSWHPVRETISLAVSEGALNILMEYSNYTRGKEAARAKLARKVERQTLEDAIDRLRAGSQSENLMAAFSSTALAFCALPPRMREDQPPPTEDLGFVPIPRDPLREMVHWLHSGRRVAGRRESTSTSFIRYSGKRENHTGEHLSGNREKINDNHPFASLDRLVISAYGAILVEGLGCGNNQTSQQTHDVCLYVLQIAPEIEDMLAISVIVEDLLQANSIYHTLRHAGSKIQKGSSYDGILWNLPCPYRPCDEQQRADICDWINELQGNGIRELASKPSRNRSYPWERLQVVMNKLRAGETYEEAVNAVKRHEARSPYYQGYPILD
ncbi:MAG: hypothetical protein M1830_008244 [Pleopsidium flavum]|nr:MAG: hypothetical protein M1830_008244 [Pleopsidium flavum]